MNWQRTWNNPVWSKVIAGVILGAGSLALALVPKDPISLGILVCVILLGGALLVWTLFCAPVAWNFDSFLGMVGDGGDLRVISFQANGRNRSGKGFHNIQGHLVSNIDNSISEQLHFVIGGTPVLPSSTTGIPPGASFQIMIPLCDMTKGYDAYLEEYDFLRRWSTFRFVVELDGYRHERAFSQRRVSEQIEKFRRVANPAPEPQVRVRP
jgi:hypothetical protein